MKTNQEIIEFCERKRLEALSHKDTEIGDKYYYTAKSSAYQEIINFIKDRKHDLL